MRSLSCQDIPIISQIKLTVSHLCLGAKHRVFKTAHKCGRTCSEIQLGEGFLRNSTKRKHTLLFVCFFFFQAFKAVMLYYLNLKTATVIQAYLLSYVINVYQSQMPLLASLNPPCLQVK